ncbi:MAG: hypothetical protein E7328_05945 [Clostridiales bacterium]|nr:hypothetical protein [Clostridiales bacterium]
MGTILVKSATFLLIVALGYGLKCKGFFKKEDKDLLSKIVSRITLPCMILTSVQNLYFDLIPLMMMAACIVLNIALLLFCRILFRSHTPIERGSAMIAMSGFNVANVTFPFVSTFLSPLCMSYAVMFDIGNSLGWLGLGVSWANQEATGSGRFSLKALLGFLMKSIPFLTYLFIILMGIFGLHLPKEVLTITGTIGNANTFLVMLMIGIMLELNISKNQRKDVMTIVGIRTAISVMLIALVLLLPLPHTAKQALCMCLVPAIPSIATVFSKELGDDSSLPAVLNSISLVLGIVFSALVLMIIA